MSSQEDPIQHWTRLLNEQTELFKQTSAENTTLRAKQRNHDTDVKVWRDAVTKGEDHIKTLELRVAQLEREVNVVRNNSLFLCLVDGDGNIFTPELLKNGRIGGRQAASLLTKGIHDYLESKRDPLAGQAQVWLTVYCNKQGLAETLAGAGRCTIQDFDEFAIGFNQASPLFSIVDVGSGKEAADAKIKESLRVFTRFPQVHKVFFGGGHDNGYNTILSQLATEGSLHKVTLLRGYADVARELQPLNLPVADIEGVFIKEKITSHPYALKKTAPSFSTPNIKTTSDNEHQRAHSKSSTGSNVKAVNVFGGSHQQSKKLDPKIPMSKHKPPPCNFFYLAKCSSGGNCRYGHNYELTQDQLEELQVNSRKTPCPQANKDQPCSAGERCIHGHVCPKGPRCPFFHKGNCKFVGKDMHKFANLAAYASPAKKKAKKRLPSPSPSPSPEPSDAEFSSGSNPYEFEQSDGIGIVNDMSPPMLATSHAQLPQPTLLSLGQSWMYPSFTPNFSQR